MATPANMGTVGGWSFKDAWMSIPWVTRTLSASMAFITLGSQLNLFPVRSVILLWPMIFQKFQIWRLITPFFFLGPLSFNLLFLAAMFFRHSRMLEEGEFLSNPADYSFFLLFVALVSLPLSYFLRLVYLGPVLLFAILQLWARKNINARVSVFGLFQLPALYYPYAMLLVNFVISGGTIDWMGITGILAGHLYYFLDTVYPALPKSRGHRIIKTPQVLIDLFATRVTPASAPARAVGRGGALQENGGQPTPSGGLGLNLGSTLRQRVTGGHSWGGGRRLGDS
uniref:Derlin n=1 Tax=Timspurckia oligopyrenoides TaxID=708627 RepID=A0A7S0ZIX1_9RHOD